MTDAARALFCERGFHSTGMAQISTLAEVKMGQIYRDFPGKDAIVEAIVEADLAYLLQEEALAHAIDSQDPAAIRAWLVGFLRDGSDMPQRQLLPEIFAEASRNDSIAHLLRTCDDRIRSSVGTALAALAPGDGKAAAREELAQLMVTLIVGLPLRILALPELASGQLDRSFQDLLEREVDRLVS